MSIPSARERRQQKTRQSILDAARQIIVEQGPDALSMRGLAGRIDYSPSGLYEYFENKEQIFQALCAVGMLEMTQAMRQVDEALPPDDYLVEIGRVYIDFATANPVLFQLMFASVPADPPSAEKLNDASSYRVLLEAIQRGIDQGVFKARPDFGLNEMAFAAWSMVHGISMLRIYMKEQAPIFEAHQTQALQAIVRGLMTPPSS